VTFGLVSVGVEVFSCGGDGGFPLLFDLFGVTLEPFCGTDEGGLDEKFVKSN